MTDKLTPYDVLTQEYIDELRAENERLLETWVTLSEENGRLRAALAGVIAEADRKTAAFDTARAALGETLG